MDDDWDGFGQKLTGTGTTTFDDVPVEDDAVFDRITGTVEAIHEAAFFQLVLLAVLAGIARAARRDAAATIASRKRTFNTGLGLPFREDPLIQEATGRIAAKAYAAEATVLQTARILDEGIEAATASGADRADFTGPVPEAVHTSEIAVEHAQVTVPELALAPHRTSSSRSAPPPRRRRRRSTATGATRRPSRPTIRSPSAPGRSATTGSTAPSPRGSTRSATRSRRRRSQPRRPVPRRGPRRLRRDRAMTSAVGTSAALLLPAGTVRRQEARARVRLRRHRRSSGTTSTSTALPPPSSSTSSSSRRARSSAARSPPSPRSRSASSRARSAASSPVTWVTGSGARPLLVASLLAMGIASTLIGLMPTFETIGWWAAVRPRRAAHRPGTVRGSRDGAVPRCSPSSTHLWEAAASSDPSLRSDPPPACCWRPARFFLVQTLPRPTSSSRSSAGASRSCASSLLVVARPVDPAGSVRCAGIPRAQGSPATSPSSRCGRSSPATPACSW